jgi:hypothetical protein
MPRLPRSRQRQAEETLGVWTVDSALAAQGLKLAKDITRTQATASVHAPTTPQIHLGITSPTLKTDLQNVVILDAYRITGAL